MIASFFKGSSGSSGERTSDLEEEVRVITKAVGHALDDLNLVVNAFEQARVKWPPGVGDDTVRVAGEALGERGERFDAATNGAAIPVRPATVRPAGRAVGPKVLELVAHEVRLGDRAVGVE